MTTDYTAILFDMDGVLIDTHQAVTAFWQALAAAYRIELTDAVFDRYIYGSPSTYTLDTLFEYLTPNERQAVLQNLEHYEKDQPYLEVPGVSALLHDLKQHGVPTALVTSGEPFKVAEVSRQLRLDDLFTTYVTAADVREGKPAPECYLLAAERLGVVPECCVVFEDSVNGMKAGLAAGALGVGVRPARSAAALLELGARYVVPDFTAVRIDDVRGRRALRLDADHLIPLG
jgi:sugar-phosphatase